MWKWLHQLARPERLYHVCGYFIPWLGLAGAACLLIGWVWGFGFAPPDYQQGESYRIMYIHVPAAMWSMGIYSAKALPVCSLNPCAFASVIAHIPVVTTCFLQLHTSCNYRLIARAACSAGLMI